MITWSVVVSALGLLASWGVTAYLTRRQHSRDPHLYWILGLAGLLPAWLIAFLGLLGSSTGGRSEVSLSVSWILSSAAALLGVIVTDALVRRLHESGRTHRPLMYWFLGIVALLPAWGIALWSLTWTRP
jgi:zinc transporter ZupT